MNEKSTRKIYDIWAYFYDLPWSTIVHRRVAKAIRHMNIRPGEQVLDIGVGTGLALSSYPDYATVTGIDLSEGMLRKARERVLKGNMNWVNLACGNALELPFPDQHFDHVLLSHVVTVVSDPVQLIEETRRVLRPDGQIVIINHFQSPNRVMAALEKWLCPICQHLGWKSDLNLNDFVREARLHVDYRYKLDPLDLFETVFITNHPVDIAESVRESAAA